MKKRMLYALLSVFFVAGCTGEEITKESTEQIEVTDAKNQTIQDQPIQNESESLIMHKLTTWMH